MSNTIHPTAIIEDGATLGEGVKIGPYCVVGAEARLGDEAELLSHVVVAGRTSIGARCKVSSHTFICEGVTIEDHVFIGHGVAFINDSYPRATTPSGELQTAQLDAETV